jgi:hypothetical protein
MRALGGNAATEPTEAEWMNGAIARRAAELGLAAPVNRRLAELVAEVAARPDRREWFRERPDRLIEALGVTATAPRAG